MKFGKVVLAGIIVGILKIAWGWFTCGYLFNWVYALQPSGVWKLPTDMSFAMMGITDIASAFLLALVYALIRNGLPGQGIVKGLFFGLFVWLVGTLPGNFALGLFTIINHTVVFYWIISGLVLNLWQGLVIAAIYK